VEENFYKTMGIVSSILSCAPDRIRLPFISLKIWVEPAILHDQILLINDIYNRPIGYFTWALISTDTLNKIHDNPDYLLHPSEWVEGDIVYMVDFVYHGRYKKTAIKSLIERMRPFQIIYWRGFDSKILQHRFTI
jgi:cytolysin-activating lysine-acyltransferase